MGLFQFLEQGTKKVAQELEAENRDFLRAQRIQTRKAANIFRNEARREITSTFKGRTGRMRSAMGVKLFKQLDGWNARIGFTRYNFYSIHERGKTIVPVRKPFLMFFLDRKIGRRPAATKGAKRLKHVTRLTRFGGRAIFARRVVIPARPILGPTLSRRSGEVVAIIGDSFQPFLGRGKP